MAVGVCAWAGCRGCELALGKLVEMDSDILESCTSSAGEMRSSVPDSVAAELAQDAESVATAITAEVGLKLSTVWKTYLM